MVRDIQKQIRGIEFFLKDEHEMTNDQIAEMFDEYAMLMYQRAWNQLGPGDRLVVSLEVKEEVCWLGYQPPLKE